MVRVHGMQMDNKPPFRPPSTDGISPVTPVLLVYAACISGASHQERNVHGDSCSRRNPVDLGLVPLSRSSLFTPLSTGLKRSLPELPLSLLPLSVRGRRRWILLEFSSSRKVDNSRTAPARGKPQIRSTIYYIINFKYVIFSRFTKWMKNIRMIAITRRLSRHEIRRVNRANFVSFFSSLTSSLAT